MLTTDKVNEVRRLLNEGRLSQRKIAKQLGVSRGTVNALATGRRGDFGREPTEARPESGPPKRCPTCGMLVYLPCVYCQAIDFRRRARSTHQAA
ncbi:MAG: helix-turn-helix domain-containing protein [Planctomycetota bacterium]